MTNVKKVASRDLMQCFLEKEKERVCMLKCVCVRKRVCASVCVRTWVCERVCVQACVCKRVCASACVCERVWVGARQTCEQECECMHTPFVIR